MLVIPHEYLYACDARGIYRSSDGIKFFVELSDAITLRFDLYEVAIRIRFRTTPKVLKRVCVRMALPTLSAKLVLTHVVTLW